MQGPMIVTVSVCVTTNSEGRGSWERKEVHMRARGVNRSPSPVAEGLHSATGKQLCINVQL